MSMTVTRTEGVTVLTVTNNPRSNCPLICQILGSLCCTPVCAVSRSLKGRLGGTQSALGAIQIMIGLLNLGMGGIIAASDRWYSVLDDSKAPFWLGGLFIFFGVVCILTEKFPSPCLVVITGLMNIASACLAITAIVLYAIDIAGYHNDRCQDYNDYYYEREGRPTPTQAEANISICKFYLAKSNVMLNGIDATMIIFAVLQLCVAISTSVLAFQAACRKTSADEDAELDKPLIDEVISGPTK